MKEKPKFLLKLTATYILTLASILTNTNTSKGETVKLKNDVKFPILINGKNVGSSLVRAGSKVEIIGMEGSKVQVKYRMFEPTWINSSDTVEEQTASTELSTSQSPQTGEFEPEKALEAMESNSADVLASMLQGHKYPNPDLQGDLEKAVEIFIKANAEHAAAKKLMLDFEKDIIRLRRNAQVVEKPNLLLPNDKSGKEKALRYREEADHLEKQSSSYISQAEENLRDARSLLSGFLENWRNAGNNIDIKINEFEEKFNKKCQLLISQMAKAIFEEISKSSPAASNINSKLDPINGNLSDWLENSFVYENLEANENPGFQNALSSNKKFTYDVVSLPSVIIPLIADKKFSSAKTKIKEYLNVSSVSTQLKSSAEESFENIIEKLNKPINESDELRVKSNQALGDNNFDEAMLFMQQAQTVDNREGDQNEIKKIKEQKKKHVFENEIGL